MQTAVELLIELLAHNNILDHKKLSSNERLYNLYKRLVEQAKEMERQQIERAWDEKCIEGSISFEIDNRTSEEYYNDTYKK